MTKNFQTLYDALIPEQVYELYESIIKTFNHQDIILDVGCGSGRLTEKLTRYADHVYAFDSDAQMIDIASKKSENITFKVHDMHENWPFYGSLICMTQDVLNFTKYPLKVLEKAIDALQGEGVILLDLYQTVSSYEEQGEVPFKYHWKRTIRFKTIIHKVTLNQETITIKQYLHHVDTIKNFLKKEGFKVDTKPFINDEKIILIAKR